MWKPTLRRLVALLLLGACAAPGAAGSGRGRPDLLTETQIRETAYATAYEVVASLRPNWLRTRGTDSITNPGQVQVYVDDIRYGGVATLAQIPTVAVRSIRWYDGLTAATRWGLDHGNGVIYVSTGGR